MTISPNDAQLIRDACDLARHCAACGHPEAPRNPLVLAADGYRVHVSHTFDPDDGYYGAEFAESRSLADITDNAMLADCGWCWSHPTEPCDTANPGGMHVERYDKALRRGLISAVDMAVVAGAVSTAESGTVLYPEAVAA